MMHQILLLAFLLISNPNYITAALIKQEVLQPLREVFECPSTPKGLKKAQAFAKGVGKSVKDTIELPLVLGKLGITAAESLIKWEDKLGLKTVQEAIRTLLKETKYDWENPEEYRARCQATKVYKEQMLAYDKAFNAAHHHLGEMEMVGYITAEALQAAFGAEIFKSVGVESKVMHTGVEVTKVTKNTSRLLVLEQIKTILKPKERLIGIQKGSNPAVRTITEAEAQRIIKQLMDMGAKKASKQPIGYPGVWYELPRGGGFGIRTKSGTASLKHGTPNTIDLQDLDLGIDKLKY
jgi:hypothetical protein